MTENSYFLQPSAILYLNKTDILQIDNNSSDLYMTTVRHAFALHANGRPVQPLKPYLHWDSNGQQHIADRIIAMPAYLGGNTSVAGLNTKELLRGMLAPS